MVILSAFMETPLAPYKHPRLTPVEQDTTMSKVRVSAEWLFGDISNWFAGWENAFGMRHFDKC